jgi:putative endonuclease
MITSTEPYNKRKKGSHGEELAARFLRDLGYEIVERNWRRKFGELDIIARDPSGETVFIEVKEAQGASHGTPESWINARKQNQIYRVAQAWLQEMDIQSLDCRFDVITVTLGPSETALNHIKNAFIKL